MSIIGCISLISFIAFAGLLIYFESNDESSDYEDDYYKKKRN